MSLLEYAYIFKWKHPGQLGLDSYSLLLLSYLGVPYSHDMCPCTYCFPGHEHCLREAECHPDNVACPLYVDEKVAEQVRRELSFRYSLERSFSPIATARRPRDPHREGEREGREVHRGERRLGEAVLHVPPLPPDASSSVCRSVGLLNPVREFMAAAFLKLLDPSLDTGCPWIGLKSAFPSSGVQLMSHEVL